jgi:two-component system, OmpR family, osmolarity sensor histidine kinase EnvZ
MALLPRLDLSRFTPRGLFARSLLIIVLPIAVMQIVLTYLFFDIHWGQVSRRLSEAAAGDIAHITRLYLADPGPATLAEVKTMAEEDLRLSVDLRADATLPVNVRRATIPAIDRTLRRALEGSVSEPFWFDTTRYPDYVEIQVEVPGGVLRYLAYRDRVFASTGAIFLMWVIGTTILLVIVSVLFIRNQVRPMERLADAAEAFGRGESVGLKPAGSREVREAAVAFLHMRNRIQRHIEQRTNLLAGVSHDLRTPLTRLKLQLAMMPASVDRDEARADIIEMERMLDEYLAFARGQWAEETEPLDLVALIREAADNSAAVGHPVTCENLPDTLTMIGRPDGLRRALANLIGNAAGFASVIEVGLVRDGETVFVHVDDNGPGIAPEDREEALKPFTRLDPSRNQNRKGVGLGLALTRDAARAHGGDLLLSGAPLGGLRATLRLPTGSAAA